MRGEKDQQIHDLRLEAAGRRRIADEVTGGLSEPAADVEVGVAAECASGRPATSRIVDHLRGPVMVRCTGGIEAYFYSAAVCWMLPDRASSAS